ncbi:MAG: hypothetical protein AB7I12_14885 [Steroidobacteraceae bacterium]
MELSYAYTFRVLLTAGSLYLALVAACLLRISYKNEFEFKFTDFLNSLHPLLTEKANQALSRHQVISGTTATFFAATRAFERIPWQWATVATATAVIRNKCKDEGDIIIHEKTLNGRQQT